VRQEMAKIWRKAYR